MSASLGLGFMSDQLWPHGPLDFRSTVLLLREGGESFSFPRTTPEIKPRLIWVAWLRPRALARMSYQIGQPVPISHLPWSHQSSQFCAACVTRMDNRCGDVTALDSRKQRWPGGQVSLPVYLRDRSSECGSILPKVTQLVKVGGYHARLQSSGF